MKDCIRSLFWPRKDIVGFFEKHGCTKSEVSGLQIESENSLKRHEIIDAVFGTLGSTPVNNGELVICVVLARCAVMQEAYENGHLKGRQIIAAKRLIEQRGEHGHGTRSLAGVRPTWTGASQSRRSHRLRLPMTLPDQVPTLEPVAPKQPLVEPNSPKRPLSGQMRPFHSGVCHD